MAPQDPQGATVPDTPPPDDSQAGGIPRLALLAAIAGAVTGLLGGLFRLALAQVWLLWLELLDWVQAVGSWRLLLPIVGAAVAAAVARGLVRVVPEAAGSGVQRVEAMMRHEDQPPGLRIIPVKFIGATLSLGVGMLLGREGPMVQMGAAVGGEVGRRAGFDAADRRSMAAAMAGAGLGVAFSAPLGGAVFVFEELSRAIRTRLVIATLIGCSVALAVAYPLVGTSPVFDVAPVAPPLTWHLVVYAVMGLLIGWLGAQYNRLLLFMMSVNERFSELSPEMRAAFVGALVGALGLLSPMFVGSGEDPTSAVLNVGLPLSSLALILLVRWVMSPVSYSVGVPGGLFAPMLAIGALLGGACAMICNAVVPDGHLPVEAFAIVGMSTFFAAVVRAPITGVILCAEMTATTALVVPMLLSAAVAVGLCTMIKSAPIYDSLRLRMDSLPAHR